MRVVEVESASYDEVKDAVASEPPVTVEQPVAKANKPSNNPREF